MTNFILTPLLCSRIRQTFSCRMEQLNSLKLMRHTIFLLEELKVADKKRRKMTNSSSWLWPFVPPPLAYADTPVWTRPLRREEAGLTKLETAWRRTTVEEHDISRGRRARKGHTSNRKRFVAKKCFHIIDDKWGFTCWRWKDKQVNIC